MLIPRTTVKRIGTLRTSSPTKSRARAAHVTSSRFSLFQRLALSVLAALLGLLALGPLPASQAAIFGNDDRHSLHELRGQPKTLFQAGAVAVAVLSSNIETRADGKLNLLTSPLTDFLCEDERFAHEPSLPYACTGFLIAPDILVTAGHCQVNVGEVVNSSENYCQAFGWLFDYQAGPDGRTKTEVIEADKFYRCKKTLYAVNEERSPFRDFAIVQLDRPVPGRIPLRLSKAPVAVGDPLTMLGFPMGTPMKFTDHALIILNNPNTSAFISNLDALDGNSGSPVFNAHGEVVGIHVAGTPMMLTVPSSRPVLDERFGRKCERLNRCDDSGKNCLLPDPDPTKLPKSFQMTGSEEQRLEPVIEKLKTLGIFR